MTGTEADPDQAWVDAARHGNEAAMERLYRRHAGAIHAYALRATARRDAADDVTQETFIRAFRGLTRFDGRSSFRTWLFAIGVNCTRTRLKRLERAGEAVGLDAVELAIEPEAPVGWTRQRLQAALHSLPSGYREAVIMHDVLEMEHEEIATARGCSVGTSKSQLHKARAKLRALLGPLKGLG
ncbi:MAG: sigma-70 family RNA polymerase sigma factor [Deltaproteobacteria bacterium]|nr:sigma-70 family RNA polymerase sigma factor [Deltaproteobacteria bacterium]